MLQVVDVVVVVWWGGGDGRGAFRFRDGVDSGDDRLVAEVRALQRRVQFDEPANIQFTSGTTGSPKGATLSHHSIVNNGYLMGFRTGYHKRVLSLLIALRFSSRAVLSFELLQMIHTDHTGCYLVLPSFT